MEKNNFAFFLFRGTGLDYLRNYDFAEVWGQR